MTKKLQREAERIAARHQPPDFYRRFKAPRALARKLYYSDSMVTVLRGLVQPMLQEDLGHGLFHSSRVSLDSATLIFVEMELNPGSRRSKERLMVLALLAGLLHDICRGQERHAQAGAEKAAILLKELPLSEEEIHGICQAIANHEAFAPTIPSKRPWMQLISDCLYDADKFRWGRDTFTHTLWHMVAQQGLTARDIIDKFPWGMTGVLRILDTFRSATGRQYGPEIVESGVEIGKEIYRYLIRNF